MLETVKFAPLAIHLNGSLPSAVLAAAILMVPSILVIVTLVPAARERYSLVVPLPTKKFKLPGVVEVAVPPFAIGRTPETSEVRLIRPAVKTPAELDFTIPLERLARVVEPERVELPLLNCDEDAVPYTCTVL